MTGRGYHCLVWDQRNNHRQTEMYEIVGKKIGTVNIVLTVKVATQFPETRNSQITDNLLKSSFSRAILDIQSTVSRQIHSPFVILQFPYSILNFVRKNPKKPFFKCHAWISSYYVNRVGEKNIVQIFSLSRGS